MKHSKNIKGFLNFCNRRKRTMIFISIVAVVMSIAIKSDLNRKDNIIEKQAGEVVAIDLNLLEDDSVNLNVYAETDDKSVERSIVLQTKPDKSDLTYQNDVIDTEKIYMNREISKTIALIESELKNKGKLELPMMTEGGVRLRWKQPNESTITFLPPIMAFLLMVFMWRSNESAIKKRDETFKMQIRNALPSFNNKLLLLLDSGLVYDDAFHKIAEDYMKNVRNYGFAKLIISIENENRTSNKDITMLMLKRAKELGIRDFTRITAMIADNRYKGADLREKLREESELLWNSRRLRAEEAGKRAETKLALPMAIMLIALIVVTAAPAMMQM